MRHAIPLTAAQVLAAIDGRLSLIVWPLLEQPPEDTYRVTRRDEASAWLPVRRHHATHNGDELRIPFGPGPVCYGQEGLGAIDTGTPYYRADGEMVFNTLTGEALKAALSIYANWRPVDGTCSPSTSMPRELSRIALTIETMDVRQVHSITRREAEAAGVIAWRETLTEQQEHAAWHCAAARADYKMVDNNHWFGGMWNARHGKRYPWADNPWCVFLTVKVEVAG